MRIDLKEGQHWDEVGSATVNARTRTIMVVGSHFVTYEDEVGRSNTILISSFRRWAKTFAECRLSNSATAAVMRQENRKGVEKKNYSPVEKGGKIVNEVEN
jgi:hypothetical protein